jgi:soluble lytic murein transglycosylase
MQRIWSVGLFVGVMATAEASSIEIRSSKDLRTQSLEAREPADLARLQALLIQREAELERMRGRLRALDEDERCFAEAESLGIVDVVRRSALTERARRRVSIAIVREAQANGLDPLLVVAVIRSESAFDAYAVSAMGAMGLMQMMPTTGTFLATQRGTTLRHRRTLFDAELNIELGTAYLAALLRQFGTPEAALVAYNAGPSAARHVLRNAERRRKFLDGYPRTVISEWRRLRSRYAAVVARRELAEPTRSLAESKLSAAQ